jgi:hypothetical protein
MNVEQLLQLIPEEHLSFLAAETKVNHQVKKLSGEVVFKLVLFSMFSSQKVSLRVMETFLQSAKFKQFAEIDDVNAKYNSIRDRICNINVDFFKKLFESIFELYNKELKEEKAISKADSTYVSISAKLVNWGLRSGQTTFSRKQTKYSVAMKGSLPCAIRVYTEAKFVSENLALGELLENNNALKESIIVFDRGLTARKSFENFTENEIHFVSRAQSNYCINVSKSSILPAKPDNSTVTLTKDEIGYLQANRKVAT